MLGLAFHHLGLAVHDPQPAREFHDALGYKIGKAVYDPLQAVNLCLCTHEEMPDIEVIWPEHGRPSPIDTMLKRKDSLIYHICYSADTVEAALLAIERLGLRAIPLGDPQPAVLFDYRLVSFYHIPSVGMIELIHGRLG